MTALTTLDFNQVPAFAKQKSAVAEALNATLASGIKRLSIKGGTFRYIAGGQEIGKIEDRHLDIVLVNAAPHISRTLYLKDYDKDAKAEAPDCWSADGIKPDAKAKARQADNCATCPKNMKGSGKGDSRACRFNQRLAVVLANDIGGEVLQLTLPATSIFGEGSKEAGATLQGYIKSLSARGIDPAALITRAKFDTDKESPALGFTPLGWLDQDQYNTAVMQGKSDAAQRAITMTVAEVDGVDGGDAVQLPSGTPPVMVQAPAPAPVEAAKPKARAQAPAPAPATITVDTDVPPPAAVTPAAQPVVAEPVVRKAEETVSASANPKLANLMQQWGVDD